MVSKLRNRWVVSASPHRRAIASRTWAAIASDSLDSIVVWFATPMRSRSRANENDGDTAFANRVASAPSVSAPPRSMKSHTSRASPMSRTTRYLPPGYFPTCEAVALVSSWKYLP